jgi:adenine-specific DNA-methyltransferase
MIKNIEKSNESVAINDKEIAILKEHFPTCFKNDGSFDIERFKETLKDKIDVVHEGYELKFLGKSYAKLLASLDTTTVITPNEEHNSQPENTNSENIYISGDNLDGLKHLLKSYAKSVKCIYIDPPYNTGSDGFVYKDNFNFTAEELQDKLSVDENQANRILELTQKGSASHSAWLLFMYSRLQLAKDLLTDDGIIFISIDNSEQANLKLLCDDIFGEENYMGDIVRATGQTTGQDSGGLGSSFDYILTYNKSSKYALSGLSLTESDLKRFENKDDKGYYAYDQMRKTGSGDRREDRPKLYYSITNPDGEELFPIAPAGYESRWRFEKKTYEKLKEENFIIWKKSKREDGEIWWPYVKYYLEGRTKRPSPLWDDIDGNKKAARDLRDLFDGNKIFDYPKPLEMMNRIIQIVPNVSNDDIFLDFFSGSASLAHAILEINASEIDSERRFIAVQLPEVLDSKLPSQKPAFDFLKLRNYPTTLDYIGIERIKRAAKKIKEETNAEIDYGFKHFILNEPNPNTLDKCETFNKNNLIANDSILDDFGVPTVLTTWLNYDGYGLTTKATAIDLKGYTAYYHQKHLYLIHTDFTQEAVMELFEKYDTIPHFNPENIVLFGYSFNEWSVTEMLEMNLKILNDTEKNLKINIEVRY